MCPRNLLQISKYATGLVLDWYCIKIQSTEYHLTWCQLPELFCVPLLRVIKKPVYVYYVITSLLVLSLDRVIHTTGVARSFPQVVRLQPADTCAWITVRIADKLLRNHIKNIASFLDKGVYDAWSLCQGLYFLKIFDGSGKSGIRYQGNAHILHYSISSRSLITIGWETEKF